METEEHEQIPWSHLVAEAEQGVDKRLYLLVGGGAALVIVIIALRLFGGGPAPLPPAEPASALPTATAPANEAAEPVAINLEVPTTVGDISQADLMAALPSTSAGLTDEARVVAEWFVTDFYTRDGSAETLASLQNRLEPALAPDLPHLDHEGPDSFVEWAHVFGWDAAANGVEVAVAFRTVTRMEAGFVRDPVAAVAIRLAMNEGGLWQVVAMPTAIAAP